MIFAEELHAGEVDKMRRKPGELASFAESHPELAAQGATGGRD